MNAYTTSDKSSYAAEWRLRNKDKIRAYYLANKETYKARQAARYVLLSKDTTRQYRATYNAKHYDKVLARSIAYHRSHKEQNNEYNRAYQILNKDKIKARKAAYEKANKEKIREQRASAKQANKETIRDRYITRLFQMQMKRLGLPSPEHEDVPSSLVESKRLQLKVKRLIKEKRA